MNEKEAKGKFVCQEGESDGINQLGTCRLCKMEYCKSCHYNNNSKTECDEFKTNFYKSSNGNSYIEELFLIKEGISLFVQIMTMIMIVANAIVTSTIPKLEK